jgi:hypothetical protein
MKERFWLAAVLLYMAVCLDVDGLVAVVALALLALIGPLFVGKV